MKKNILMLSLIPTLALAHESNSESVTHAIEHQLQNPFWAVALFIGLAVSVHLARLVFKKIKENHR